jgi:hypothetical protein
LPENRRYSLEFENAVAEYVIGNPSDRGEKTMFELYTKLGYAHSFFAFCERYFSLSGKRFIEVGCGTAYVSVAATRRHDILDRRRRQSLGACRPAFREHSIPGVILHADLREPLPIEKWGGAFEIGGARRLPIHRHGEPSLPL